MQYCMATSGTVLATSAALATSIAVLAGNVDCSTAAVKMSLMQH
jgi:hypothetical protein